MTELLNPSEAQRKAMAVRLCDSMGLDEEVGLYEVDRQIAAANSIPEGAPVGTIARRPDGEWVAIRRRVDYLDENQWWYLSAGNPVPDLPPLSDADSWPVIFTPGEAVGSGPTTDGVETYDPTKPRNPNIWRVAEWLEEHDDGDPYEIYTPDGSYGYRLSASKVRHHPVAQQGPVDLLAPYDPVDGAYTAESVAAQIKKRWEERRPKPYRDLRVVDRLGVDEQGSRWRDRDGDKWRYQANKGWQYTDEGKWVDQYMQASIPEGDGPYTEILEPRVLPTLDCEEARDGTVWRDVYPGTWTYWHNGIVWTTDQGEDSGQYPVQEQPLLTDFGPYTEVLDVG